MIQFLCGQDEETKEEKLHIQGYVQFTKKKRFTGAVKIFPSGKWRVEPARSSAEANTKYCSKKPGKNFEQFGLCVHERKTTELAIIKKRIDEGVSEKVLWDEHWPTMVRCHRGIREGIRMLRLEEAKAEFELKEFGWDAIEDWSKAHIIWGKTGIGKTEFALAHFKRPALIRHIGQLGQVDWGKCDGLVFDDMNFMGNSEDKGRWPAEAQIHLVDLGQASGINIKHGHAMIPKGMKRIFTTNCTDGYIVDLTAPAIKRRVAVQEVTFDGRTICQKETR